MAVIKMRLSSCKSKKIAKFPKLLCLIALSLIIFATIAQTVNAVELSVKTIPDKPTTGKFVIRVDVVTQNPIQSANLVTSGFLSKSVSLGDFTGKASAEFEAHANKPGIYELEVRLSYVEIMNGTPESGYLRGTYAIVVTGKPQFEILSADGSVKPGETGNITIKAVNMGGDARDVKLNFSGFLAKDPDRFFFSWKSNEIKVLKFVIYADKNMEVGEHKAKLGIECKDEFGNPYSFELPLSVSVTGKPRLAISEFTTIPAKIHPDTSFTLRLGVENVGKDLAKNVRVGIKLPKGFSGENVAYLGEIKRGVEKFAEFELKVAKNVSGERRLEVKIFSDEGKWTENLTVFVFSLEPVYIDIAGVYTIPKRLEKNKPFTLNLAVENSGKEVAKAVRIELKLPEEFKGRNTYFIGTLESGDSATSTFELEAAKPGEYRINAVITYLDPTLQRHTSTQELTLYVFPSQNYAPVILVALIIAIGLALKFRRRA